MKKEISLQLDEAGSLIIYDDGSSNIISAKPAAWLNEKCLDNGSSLRGRTDAFCELLKVRQKPAALISEVSGEIWFPTLSPKQNDCVWIRYDEILDVKAIAPQSCEIIFFNGFRMKTDVDARVIRLQMKRCRTFLELLHHE
ncbi:MAG: competence protein ComK [Solobacterium sp.]|nr:competence protein ComK [Solobacterium sp.]